MKSHTFLSIPFFTLLLTSLHLSAAEELDFNRDIKPLLSSKCFKCHGADEGSREADLRLDTFEGATKNLDGHFAIKPGNSKKSELIARLITHDPDDLMPPAESGKPLKPNQIERLKQWIDNGAKYERHWSFVPPVRHQPPSIQTPFWPKNEIDYFVLSRLEKDQVTPQAEADRYQLIRRASLDITGLPPQPKEVAAFINDPSPQAYEKLIDRLLASSAYGERWAAMWLDLARYADSMGYASDNLRSIWAYRDWVIQAYNTNMPYDQFTLAQIAGDLLPKANKKQLIATAFHRNTMNNTEGGTDNEEFRVAAVKDRVSTTMNVWMGLTMRCAECHTHKYDPITHKEYYQFYDFFNQTADADTNDDAPFIAVPGSNELKKRAALDQKIAAVEKQISQADPAKLLAEQKTWEAQYLGNTQWTPLGISKASSIQGSTFEKQQDGSILVTGKPPKNDTYTLAVTTPLKLITGFRLEAIPDKRNPAGGSGRAPDGSFILSRFAATLDAGGKAPQARYLRIELPGKNKILNLAEVEVFNGKNNLALKGKATQSSTYLGGEAKRAIDGNTNGLWNNKSVSHTTSKNKSPWWEVDLGKSSPVDRITIWNRTDDKLQSRIDGYQIKLYDQNRKLIWQNAKLKGPKISQTFHLTGPRPLIFTRATADFSQDKWPISNAIPTVAKNLAGWSVSPKQKERHQAFFVTSAPTEIAANNKLEIILDHHYNYGGQKTLGRFRISVTDDPALSKRATLRPDMLTIIDQNELQRSAQAKQKLALYFRDFAPSLAKLRGELGKIKKQRDAIKPPTVPIITQLAQNKQRKTQIHARGNFMDLGDQVKAAVPASFNPFPKNAPANRIGVAQWLTSTDNPLTARVAVNRIWAQLFGAGIVETEEDFGAQGTYPTHPKLLDWLATEYMRNGWDSKALLKTIVMSATYRQSSKASPQAFDADHINAMLARGPRFRLNAEQVRDQALALSGLLSHKMHGPSVYPPQPPGMWRAAFNGQRNWATSKGEDRYRRGLYTFWRRSVPYPSMATFDAPSREVCNLRRIRTNTPLQAFVTLNDPVYVEIAQAMARRIIKEGGKTNAERIRFALQLVLVRPPSKTEQQVIATLFQKELNNFKQNPAAAKTLATNKGENKTAATDPIQLATWTAITNILLNLDAVLTKS
ncbi:MAG: DUF1553 domain-containing protein [Verrucomicrobiales bacterium]|nr:DUF1553 domain-containing protein [Verrucomicrobiales bacterium]